MCLNPGHILQNRYQIIDKLGKGGSGITYTAKDMCVPENPMYVVKEILPPESNDARLLEEAQRQFEREAKTLKDMEKCKCPCIPRLIDHFVENGKFYLIQEYIEGNPLNQEIIPGKQFEESEVIDLLFDILSVLECVHSQGIIHRDIKPSNLIRRKLDGKIVLIDFGAVKGISNLAIESGNITQTRAVGTQGYMPAEQWKNQPRFNSDIYAVGIIGIQAITGFDISELNHHTQACELIWRYSKDGNPIVQISDGMINILNQMVRYDPVKDRYQSAAEVLQDLQDLQDLQNVRSASTLELSPELSQESVRQESESTSTNGSRIWLFVPIALLVSIAAFVIHHLSQPKASLIIQGDAVSGGEEVLIKTSGSRVKERGAEEFAQSKYQSALNLFKQSWKEEERKDPETLIYMNNAFLQAKKADYYTIAVAVPVSNSEGGAVDADLLAKEILRGIAHAQTEVNLGLLHPEPDFPGQGFLAGKAINGKGLRVIIANDANVKAEAKARAASFVKQTEILGVVGHYTSETTVATVDIYNENRLVLISPGSTTEQLTEKHRQFFFRTVPTNRVNADVFTKYLIEKAGQAKAAGFYCPDTQTTFSFWEEFRKQFKQGGRNIVSISEFDLCKQNFNVEKALREVERTEKTAIILSPSHLPDASKNVMAFIKANDNRNWIAGTGGVYSQKTLETCSQLKSCDRLLASSSWHPLAAPDRTFADRTRQLWGGNVSHRTALSYDAAKVLIKAIETQQQPSREGMQKTIASQSFSATGASGTIEFDAQGDRKNFRPGLVHIVKCQKEQFGVTFVPIQYATATEAGLKCE
jgi:eukaryotic-like serine/threonine-protein kinase